MTTRKHGSIPAEDAVITQRLTVAIARAESRAVREEAAALRAESGQARRQARAVLEQRNAILDAAMAITTEVLTTNRIALAQPVSATFQTDRRGSTGVEIVVRLKDPHRASAAKRLIDERFGGECGSDVVPVS